MRISREDLLQQLESVQPGLSPKEIVEQSSCFCFKDGYVTTFNDEVACRRKTSLSITGAVSAAPMIAILQKLVNDDLEIEAKDGQLLISAKNKRTGIRMENEILLPIETVEKAAGWRPIPDDFVEAVDMCHQCASDDESSFNITCVHIHPKWLEASDNYQLTRYKLKTGVKEPILVKHSSIKHIVSLGMAEMCESDSWIHFRNKPNALQFSCRRYLEEFPDITEFLKVHGDPLALPKGLGEATDKAEIFSSEDADNNQVLVEIRPGKLRIKGQGASGWYSEVKKLNYKGAALSFHIAPKLLKQLCERHNECEVTQDRLKIDGGKYVYIASLGRLNDDKEEKNGETEE